MAAILPRFIIFLMTEREGEDGGTESPALRPDFLFGTPVVKSDPAPSDAGSVSTLRTGRSASLPLSRACPIRLRTASLRVLTPR